MKVAEIQQHYTAKNLEAIAQKLPKEDAFRMFDTMESIARIIVGEAAFCAASATNAPLKELAKEHLNEANEWADYLGQQKQTYR